MVDNSQMIVGLYPLNKDFTKDRNSGTASCLRYAKGKIPICLIDPESHLIEFHPCNEQKQEIASTFLLLKERREKHVLFTYL